MLPALARRAIEEYSEPGDLVLDPMCGAGTTLVEAGALDRRCLGVDLEARWAELSQRNVDHVLDASQRRRVRVRVGDARNLASVFPRHAGRVDLILTSPPYACDVATVEKSSDSGHIGCAAENFNYSESNSNIGHARGNRYVEEMAAVYASCFEMLKPGGLLVTVTKNLRRGTQLFDLAALTCEIAQRAGFTYLQHVIALQCGIRDSELVGRPSFWQLQQTRRARERGLPIHLVVHEDVLVLAKGQHR